MNHRMPHVSKRLSYLQLLDLIGDYTEAGNGKYRFSCPAHGGDNESGALLTVVNGEQDYKLCCFTRQCGMPAIYNAIAGGYTIENCKKSEKRPSKKRVHRGRPAWQRQAEAIYPYTDEFGEYLFEKVRFREYDKSMGEPKYIQRRKDPNRDGRHIYRIEDVRKVLYNLPSVIKSDIVFVCEGEKDCDILIEWGHCATTNFDGAWKGDNPKWNEEYTDFLKGKNIIIIPDPDECGMVRGNYIQKCLVGHSQVLQLVLRTPDGCDVDVGDWRDNGGSKERFGDLLISCMENID